MSFDLGMFKTTHYSFYRDAIVREGPDLAARYADMMHGAQANRTSSFIYDFTRLS